MWPTIGSREENNQTDATATTLAITPPTAAWVSSRVLRRCWGMPRASTSVKAMLPDAGGDTHAEPDAEEGQVDGGSPVRAAAG